ncbi:unnamed protein product, partial [Effrenium voratum]
GEAADPAEPEESTGASGGAPRLAGRRRAVHQPLEPQGRTTDCAAATVSPDRPAAQRQRLRGLRKYPGFRLARGHPGAGFRRAQRLRGD